MVQSFPVLSLLSLPLGCGFEKMIFSSLVINPLNSHYPAFGSMTGWLKFIPQPYVSQQTQGSRSPGPRGPPRSDSCPESEVCFVAALLPISDGTASLRLCATQMYSPGKARDQRIFSSSLK